MADGAASSAAAHTDTAAVAPPDAQELAAAFDATPLRAFLLDASHRIRWANRAGAAFFDLSPGDIVGRDLRTMVGPARFAEDAAPREAAIAGEAGHFSGWTTHLDGRPCYVERDYLPHPAGPGRGYMVIARDETPRAAAEAEVRRVERLLRDALENLPLGVAIEDDNSRLLLCNQPYASFYGATTEALTGLDFAARMARLGPAIAAIGGEVVADAAGAEARLAALRERRTAQVEIALRDGRQVLNRSAPLETGGRVVVYDDITALRARDREAVQARRMLADAIANLPAGVAVEDPEGRIRICNAAYASFYGASTDVLAGMDFAARMHLLGSRLLEINGERGDGTRLLLRLAAARRESFEPLELVFRDGRRCLVRRAETAEGGRVVIYTDVTALRDREREAEEARRLLADAVEAVDLGFAVFGSDGGLTLWNERLCALFGADAIAPGGDLASLIGHAAALGRLAAAEPSAGSIAAVLSCGDGIAEIELSDGRILAVAQRQTGAGGHVVTFRDVTATRRAEDAMRESWETVTRVLEACPTPISMSRAADATILYANPAGETLLGYREGGWVGRRITDLWNDPADHAAAVAALQRDGRLDGLEGRFVRDDGQEIWLSIWARHATFRGEPVFVSAATDLTERRRAEAVLRDSWETVTRVMEACPAPIGMTRAADGEILYANPALERVLGFEPGTGAGRHARDNWADPAEHAAAVAELRRTGRIQAREARFVRRDGTVLTLALSATAASFRGEEVFVTCSVDLTAQRAQEAELARQREINHQAEKLAALGELLAGVSHELNNPLTVIVGEAAILRETAETDWVRARADRLADAADRCARIVRSFLAMARQGPARRDPVDLAVVVRAAAELAGPEMRAAGARITLDLDETAPPVAGDSDQLRQVVMNLLVNAAHAVTGAPGPRRVTVTLAHENGRVSLAIADTGPGVPASIAGRIFEPLFTTKPVGRGSGLGLALCHRLVSAHGGRLSLRNPGQPGAVFDVDLPAGAAVDAGTAAPLVRPGSLRVLVVDDDAEVARTTASLLTMDGHAVTVVASGHEALAAAAAGAFDLVVTDVRMPEMDGLEFWRRLSATRPALAGRVAFATGDLLSPDVAAALRATGQPVLEKPFLPEDLRGIVDAAREGRVMAGQAGAR